MVEEVLAIVGALDKITPVSEACSIADQVPDGRLAIIPDAAHLSNLENPEAFNAALRSFLGSP